MAGRLIDLIWHATHPGFETAGDQVQAHAVVWLGGRLLLAASIWAVVRGTRNRGYVVVLVDSGLYGGVAVWHSLRTWPVVTPSCPTSYWWHLPYSIVLGVFVVAWFRKQHVR